MRALLLLGAAALAPRGASAADAATIYRQFTAAPHVPGVLEANRHPSPHPVPTCTSRFGDQKRMS